jgi:hypothetical protein
MAPKIKIGNQLGEQPRSVDGSNYLYDLPLSTVDPDGATASGSSSTVLRTAVRNLRMVSLSRIYFGSVFSG